MCGFVGFVVGFALGFVVLLVCALFVGFVFGWCFAVCWFWVGLIVVGCLWFCLVGLVIVVVLLCCDFWCIGCDVVGLLVL